MRFYFGASYKAAVLSSNTNILPAKSIPTSVPIPASSSVLQSPTPSAVPKSMRLTKSFYAIALFGDSMIDTMGEHLEYLQKDFSEKYPGTVFHLYNYGIGSQNAEQGFARFYTPFSNRERSYPPISQINADVVVIGSFAYNPFSPYNRDQHWLALKKLVKEAKKTSSAVYMLAEIAPLSYGFGKGPHGVNWNVDLAYQHATHILELLQNAIDLARELNVPVIDAFNPSKENGVFGIRAYVNPDDGIHPSVAGHEFMAKEIADTILLH